MSVDLPPEVTPLLDELVSGITDALGDNLVGVYLRGSLALGGFDPATSDVDVLVVTEHVVWGGVRGACGSPRPYSTD